MLIINSILDFQKNNNSFTVLSGSNVSLIAGSEIIINSEFIAQEGCTFIAINAPCEGNNISKKLTTSGDYTETIDIEEEIKTELITNNSLLDVELFPNPFKNYLLLNYSIEKRNNITITIYNISGNIVYRKNIPDFYGTQYENINTTNLPAGLYVLTVQTSDSLFSSKIIKSE